MNTRIRGMLASAALSAVLAGGTAPGVLAHDPHRHGAPPEDGGGAAVQAPPEKIPRRLDEGEQRGYFTDTRLLDQDGREVRFYTDALRGKIVLISFIYTSCEDHSMTFVRGDVKNARWSKLRGDQPPEILLPRIRDLMARREEGAKGTK